MSLGATSVSFRDYFQEIDDLRKSIQTMTFECMYKCLQVS